MENDDQTNIYNITFIISQSIIRKYYYQNVIRSHFRRLQSRRRSV